ncbi:MAG: glycosyl hydrolase [Planctomycetia bacterium]|nr:glycosyl hydrolase [Planctomycetia bacterium]
MRRFAFLLLSFFFLPIVAVFGESLRPIDIEQFFVSPDTDATIHFAVEESETPPLSGHYRIIASDGESIYSEGEGSITCQNGSGEKASRILAVNLRLPEGFWELDFDAAADDNLLPGRRFGIVSLPVAREPYDDFFAIDGALSWLTSGDELRVKLIRIARRGGIGMIRERLHWGSIESVEGTFDWENTHRYQTLRQAYQAEKVNMLELFHDAPAWLRDAEVYPDDLVKTSKSFQTLADHWQGVWSAIEIWNEPEIMFGGYLPADQYAAVWKAVRRPIRQNAPSTKIVAGVLSHFCEPWLKAGAASGILNDADVFSYHTYDHAPAMEKLVADYRGWLQESGKATIPLWITECGRPWKIGPERPVPEQDVESACDIVMKGVEARACGVARYFPFVYPYYEETVNNFGMMDRRNTPLRAFAAYLTLVRVLAGTDYLGDIPLERLTLQENEVSSNAVLGQPEILRARVFGRPDDPNTALVVLYTGKQGRVSVAVPFPVDVARSMTGELIPPTASPGTVSFCGGLVYLTVPRAALTDILTSETAAMTLYQLGVASRAFKREPGPDSEIILRYRFDRTNVTPNEFGYHFLGDTSHPQVLTLEAFNLSDQAQTVDFQFASDGDISVLDRLFDEEGPVVLPPQSRRALPVSVRFGDLAALGRPTTFDVQAFFTTTDGEPDLTRPADRISLSFRTEPRLHAVLTAWPDHEKIVVNDPGLWTLTVSDGGVVTPVPVDDAMRFDVTFTKKNDRWVYPKQGLPEICSPERMKNFVGLFCRIRATGKMTSRVFLYEKPGGGSYMTNGLLAPADGKWHTALVRPEDLSLCPATGAIDANGYFNPEDVDSFSFGFNSDADTGSLEIDDVYFLFE